MAVDLTSTIVASVQVAFDLFSLAFVDCVQCVEGEELSDLVVGHAVIPEARSVAPRRVIPIRMRLFTVPSASPSRVATCR